MNHQRLTFTRNLLKDLAVLQRMFDDQSFERNQVHIGAEQEVTLTDADYQAAPIARQVLSELDDPRFVHEYGLFDLEYNAPPQVFKDGCLDRMQQDLKSALLRLDQAVAPRDAQVVLTGILPTLHKRDLHYGNMTPLPRYREIDRNLRELRGDRDFQVSLCGEDELNIRHGCSLLEAATTSFQIHYQIDPGDFADQYNWAQLIAGPLLAVSTNSPLLFGARLWRETRIGLFRWSIDTRQNVGPLRERMARVKFGQDWASDSPLDLFWDDLAAHRFIATEMEEDQPDTIDGAPALRAFQLFNGTVYRWNRVCYGVTAGKPHLRIENRMLSAGPTLLDQMANACFWWGLMAALDEDGRNLPVKIDFDDVRANFFTAAKMGIDAQLKWHDGRTYPARTLVLRELLPLARRGLRRFGIHPSESDPYLAVLQHRCETRQTGAAWLRRGFSNLLEKNTPVEALHNLTAAMAQRRQSGDPVCEWSDVGTSPLIQVSLPQKTVDQVMETNLITLDESDLADLAYHLRRRRDLHFIPVETSDCRLIGLIDCEALPPQNQLTDAFPEGATIAQLMDSDPPHVYPHTRLSEALIKMAGAQLRALPVVNEGKLVGLFSIDCFPQIVEPELFILAEKVRLTLEIPERAPLYAEPQPKPHPLPVPAATLLPIPPRHAVVV